MILKIIDFCGIFNYYTRQLLTKIKTVAVSKLILLGIFIFCGITLKASYNGCVFLDNNENAQFDTGDKGVEGVCVSDGLHVVKTDAGGNFILPGAQVTRFIFITVPAGYKAAGKHYIPIGSKDASYDFALKPYKRTLNSSKFIQLADTETHEHKKWIKDVKDYSTNYDVGFIIHTGDICYEDGLNFHAENVNSHTMGVPVYYCIGNHDLVKGEYGEQLFETLFGPVYYSFDAGNTHFIVTPMANGDVKPSYTLNQLYEWLINDLEHVSPEKNLVVFNHDLLTYDEKFHIKGRNKKYVDLNEHNLKAWVYGHWHINFYKKHGGDGPVSVCASTPDKGGIDHSPSNFLVFNITNEGEVKITPRYTYVERQLAITTSESALPYNVDRQRNLVSVNTYHTSAQVQIVKGLFINPKGSQITLDFQQNSDWNWSVVIPDWFELSESTEVQVEVAFDDGKNIIQKGNFSNEKEGLSIKWLSNLNANTWMAKAVVGNSKVFVATIDDFAMEKCGIHALDIATGDKLWTYKTKGSIKNSFCYSKEMVLLTDHFGNVYALNANDGQLLWETSLGQSSLGAFVTGSVVKDDIYYTGFGNYLKAIDINSGSVIWQNKAWSGGEGNTATMTVVNDVLITGSNWNALYIHDISNGNLLWKMSDNGFRFRSSSATCHNDTLYVCSQKGIGLFNVYTGELYQYVETPYDLQVATKPIVYNGLIIFGTSGDGIVAYDIQRGDEVWHINTGEALFYTAPYSSPKSQTVESAPELINGEIFFGASDGCLYRVNPIDGTVIQKFELGAPILAPVASFDKGFIISDFGGNVYSFEVND
ncbi:PQQ-binding-like beta-propeller repeat protein [Carboxylicivirga sediminis]|uniref:PQQ-binding-like beta-propeller repeat protein n=1 Tax=Carboxylicivirga sediminis TaxID=2006564 RepID=A0A941IXW3_9BACT|nr:PQQ-binding-like beta-propeller repeat protein [Carboxylicivirga sediminis]MBR8535874.1 PQQ-binding-like beta-propeller repeat protein [Carboxylicivirga sediminis]